MRQNYCRRADKSSNFKPKYCNSLLATNKWNLPLQRVLEILKKWSLSLKIKMKLSKNYSNRLYFTNKNTNNCKDNWKSLKEEKSKQFQESMKPINYYFRNKNSFKKANNFCNVWKRKYKTI